MRERGTPQIHAYWRKQESAWYALEDSHRIAAASELNLIPVIIRVYLHDRVTPKIHQTFSKYATARAVLKFYDEHQWWTRYEFPEIISDK